MTGGSIPATGVCTIALDVLGGTAGDKNNSVTVSSDNGGTGNTANATLTVVGPPSIAEAFGAATVPLNGTTSLTFTITNPSANTVAESGVAFTDTLPSGLEVTPPVPVVSERERAEQHVRRDCHGDGWVGLDLAQRGVDRS